MKVSFGYSDSEDRMWIRAGRDGPLWWLTRRMALRLVTEWAALLERSLPPPPSEADGVSAGAAAGAGLEADAAARLVREHAAALANPRRAPGEEGGAPAADGQDDAPVPAGASALVFAVDLGWKGDRIRVVLRSAAHRQAVVAPRDDCHRLLATLVSRCRRNGWLDARLPSWVASRPLAGGQGRDGA